MSVSNLLVVSLQKISTTLFCTEKKQRMKHYNILIFVLAGIMIHGNVSSQKKQKTETLQLNDIEKSLAKVSDNLYAGKYEVSNSLYRIFEDDLKKNNKTDALKISKVDTLNWRDKLAFNEPYVDYYYRHPAYKDYPVVNISYDAAVLFCEWLTTKYNESPKRKFKKVLFRLPTSKEWTKAARCEETSIPYPWGSKLLYKSKNACNFKSFGDERITFRKDLNTYEIVKNPYSNAFEISASADITAPVKSYIPNKFGLYNVCGNVAEMLVEKGKTRGGGWKDTGWDVRIDAVGTYEKSATDIGFRYFMDVIEK